MLKEFGESEEFIGWLEKQTAHAHAIGVICAYSAQRDLVRKKLALSSVHQKVRESLKVDTIDSYQGKENPIDIVSLVRNNWRSEEHTSELQSPMRISYAVFCLKKKTN